MNETLQKTVHLSYYAVIREKTAVSGEDLETMATDARALYREVESRHGFSMPENVMRVSVNDVFSDWRTKLKAGDRVAFIPPVSGG